MNTCIYDKTDKGREEIATRKYQVPAKLRTLLVLVDGRRPLDTLLKNVSGLGLNQDSIDQLLASQYISLVSGGASEQAAPAQAARTPVSARARALARSAAARMGATQARPKAPLSAEEAEAVRALHAFFNHTVAPTIGLRGYLLQSKAEKAASIEEFRALRKPYLEAVLKAKGGAMARRLRGRLDHLLGGVPETDDVVLPDD